MDVAHLQKEIVRIQVFLLYFMLFAGGICLVQPSSERIRDFGLMFLAGLGPVSRNNPKAMIANRFSWALCFGVWSSTVVHMRRMPFDQGVVAGLAGFIIGWICGDRLEQIKK